MEGGGGNAWNNAWKGPPPPPSPPPPPPSPPPSPPPPPPPPSPPPPHHLAFYWDDAPRTYDEAVAHCASMGGTLPFLRTDLEFVNTQAQYETKLGNGQPAAFMWVGLNDRNAEGTFVNPDGTPYTLGFDAKYWESGEPNDGDGNVKGGEDCVVFMPNTKTLNDVSCDMSEYNGIPFRTTCLVPTMSPPPPPQ